VVIDNIEPVGNYAVRLIFSDRHDTGIFSFDMLYDLGCKKFHYMRKYLRHLKLQGKSRRLLKRKT
jgi:DUF971 family protein